MSEFVNAVWHYSFLQNALLIGVLAAIACGVVGTFVVTRRITYIGGGIAHSVLGGMGAAYYLSVVHGWSFLHPKYGAVVAALIAAVIIGWVSLRARQRMDTVIGSIWAIGMAIGILFISRTPGYNEDLMSYLFGNILMVSPGDIWLIAILDVVILAVVLLFFHQLQAVCFDEQFARVRGLNVELYYLILLILTALTVVILVTVVGIVMVIAMLTLPAAVAGYFTRGLRSMMIVASILSVGFTLAGLAFSYGPNLPSGATTIVIAGATYLVVSLISAVRAKTIRA